VTARLSLLALVALLAAVASGCGGNADSKPGPPPVQMVAVGSGARGAVVLKSPGPTARRPVVVFLHGVFATDPREYGPWLDHLAREGAVVVYPTYQEGLTPPASFLANAVAGIRAALARVPADERRLVVAGHSAGGALAADYAAIAPRAGLPPARVVFAAYPGRALPGLRVEGLLIPPVPGALVPRRTRIVALAGADDRTVGTATARAIVAGATRVPRARRSYRLVTTPAADDHLAPQRPGPASRRVFWRALDRLLADVR
jgi:pimeloyl-ACP methyl ester carboxylesterase